MPQTTAKLGQYSIKAEGKKKASLRLVGSINWWKNSGDQFTAVIDQLEADGVQDVDLYINSGGGSVFDANEIANQLKRLPGAKTCRIGALCASAATLVSMACDKRIMARNGMYMIHEPRISVQDATIDDLERNAGLLKTLRSGFIDLYAKRTALSKDIITTMLAKETWMNAETAKSKGFVTLVGDADEDVEATAMAIESLEAESELPIIQAWIKEMAIPNDNLNSDHIAMKIVASHIGKPEASETDILEYIKGLEAKVSAQETKAKEEAKARATTLTDQAIKDGKITALDREKWIEKATADFDFAQMALGAINKRSSASAILQPNEDTPEAKNEDRSKWTYADWFKNDHAGLVKMHKDAPAEYERLGKAHYGKQFKA